MNRGRAVLSAMAVLLLAIVAIAGPSSRPAAANHDQEDDELWVTVAINAAGGDRLSVTDDTFDDTGSWVGVASDVAIALGHPSGTFRAYEDISSAYVELDDKLAEPRGSRFSYAVDSGKLQLLAQAEGYEALLLEVCTPRVRQVVDTLVAPESLPMDSPGSRCRGWYQLVDDPPIRAVVELNPDRDRYPLAVGRTVGTAAIAFGIFGIGATLLRHGPLRRRSVASWLLAVAAAVLVAPVGWGTTTGLMWWNGTAADAVMLSGGSIAQQVARTMLPGLVFLVPALLPAFVLLTVPRKEKRALAPLPAMAAPAPQAAWWPAAWWPQWAAQNAEPGPHRQQRPVPPPAQEQVPAPPGPPPPPQPGWSDWAPPGSGSG